MGAEKPDSKQHPVVLIKRVNGGKIKFSILPDYLFLSMCSQIVIRLTEMLVPEEAVVGG